MLLCRSSRGSSFVARRRWPPFSKLDGWWGSFESLHKCSLLLLASLLPHVNRHAKGATGLANDVAVAVDGIDAAELSNVG
eukprot:3257158-Lingulodinium_polyedra.AAC.1